MAQAFKPIVAPVFRGLYSTTTGITPQGLNGAAPGTAANPNFTDQLTVEESHHDELEVTDHPIAQNAPITDHAFARPAELTLRIGWSQAGTERSDPQSAANLNIIYAGLKQGQANRVLYNVQTGKRFYTSMIIKTISVQTDKRTENVLLITLGMRQVILVSASSVAISSVTAAPADQAQPQATQATANVGTAQLQPGTSYQAVDW